jgi:hypothetical protein
MFSYGKHFPSGFGGVQWIISSEYGTRNSIQKIDYIWNYYNYSDLPRNHPYDKDALISYANGTYLTTCLDANYHLLFDFNHDGELDGIETDKSAYAYYEHSGRGVANQKMGNPFTNFWFDDNSFAKFMNIAYDLPIPSGLSVYDDFVRYFGCTNLIFFFITQ